MKDNRIVHFIHNLNHEARHMTMLNYTHNPGRAKTNVAKSMNHFFPFNFDLNIFSLAGLEKM